MSDVQGQHDPIDETTTAEPRFGAVADAHTDGELAALIAAGRKAGYLTFDQVNAYLPDEAVDPAKIDALLVALEERGIELVDTPPVPRDAAAPPPAPPRREEVTTSAPSNAGSDPIRMYLAQMAEIPLLSRREEISLAKRIEVTRKRFRRAILGCTYSMQSTVDTLRRVHEGALPFDRTIKVSLTERLTKEQIQARMPHNLKTLDHLLTRSRADFRLLVSRSTSAEDARQARRRFRRGRAKALVLVEELSLRTRRVQPLVKLLRGMSSRMDQLQQSLREMQEGIRSRDDQADMRKELRDLMLTTLESPRSLRTRVAMLEKLKVEYEAAKRNLSAANLRLVVSIAKKFIDATYSFDELVSEGNVALMRAVEKFNFALGNRFSTYATYAIQRHFFRLSHRGRQFRKRFVADDEALRERAAQEPAHEYRSAEQIDLLKGLFGQFLGDLEPREREIVVARFGFDGKPPRTFRELGSEMGVCKERIRQIQGRAIEKLRDMAAGVRLEQTVGDWL